MKVNAILARETFKRPIYVSPGDTVSLSVDDPLTGKETLVSHEVTKTGVFDEGVIFEGEFEGRAAIGGAFVAPK